MIQKVFLKYKKYNFDKMLYFFLILFVILFIQFDFVFAATDVWTKAHDIMKDVYSQIVKISTMAAVVTASIALLMINFSRDDRTVTESRAWLKRILTTWAILNGLGFIIAYITPFFQGGVWTV